MSDKAKKPKGSNRKFALLFWLLVLVAPFFIYLFFWLINVGTIGQLPSFEELENPKSLLASEIISADQQTLGTYFKENRSNVNYNQISPFVINALVATEDERYYEHSGIDFRAVMRAVSSFGTTGGASTITQQLAKMLFHERSSNIFKRIFQKLQEWVIAVKLERQYTKQEILAMYLNKFDFVNNAVGIKSAAFVYFGKNPKDLNIAESAMLVGMAKNPALFNPMRRAEQTLQRRNVVFGQMLKNNLITPAEFDSLKVLPLGLEYNSVDHKEGVAPYFREVLRQKLSELFGEKNPDTDEYVLAKADGSPYNIYQDGLKIYTTIDSRMQRYAESAVQKYLGEKLQADLFRDIYTSNRKRKNPPFSNSLTEKERTGIINQARNQCSHYLTMVGKECPNCGRRGKVVSVGKEGADRFVTCSAEDCQYHGRLIDADSVDIVMNTKSKMKVFTYQGEADTLLSPIDSILYYKTFLQVGMMSMDPRTGFIKAWVGGPNFKYFNFDHVQQSKRQVGSTFKPFVYSLAMQAGYSPCTEVPNILYCFDLPEGGQWCPQNSDGKYGGCSVTLKAGLANSMNTITAWVMSKFGPHAVVEMARKLGITSPLDPVPALCLGVADLSVYEMVGAYSTFANKGVWTEPVYITRIEDKNGTLIKEFKPETHDVMSEESAYVMLSLMKGVSDGAWNACEGKKIGTGLRIRASGREYGNIRYPIAGKTGTTQNNSDGWYMGITPDLVSGVWVGCDDRSIHFSTTNDGQGANSALPIWGYYMNSVYKNPTIKISTGDFERPSTPITIELDCDKFNNTNGNGFSGGNGDDDSDMFK